MENDDKDDGYSEEEDEEICIDYILRNRGELDESMISQVPGCLIKERMTVRNLADCAESAFPTCRRMAAGEILEALQSAVTSVEAYSEQDEVIKVFAYISRLSRDKDKNVRCNLLSSLLKVASFCAEYDSPLVSLKDLIERNILMIVLNFIADDSCDMKMLKEGYSTLKYLLNENLVRKQILEERIHDIYTSFLVRKSNVRNVIAGGSFLLKMLPVVGDKIIEKLLLPKISELCNFVYSKVREACPHFLVRLACFVDSLITENVIVPLFIKLSEDDIFCVRMSCAKVAVMLSTLCLMESRKTLLSRVFLNLLQDSESIVSSTAFKQLGAFITTFAQPSLIAFGSSRNGELQLIYYEGSIFDWMSCRSMFPSYEQEKSEESLVCLFMLPMKSDRSTNTVSTFEKDEVPNGDARNFEVAPEKQDDTCNNNGNNDFENEHYSDQPQPEKSETVSALNKSNDVCSDSTIQFSNKHYENQPDLVQSCLQKSTCKIDYSKNIVENITETADHFNSFQFWRDPIPDFDEQEIYPNDVRTYTESRCEITWCDRLKSFQANNPYYFLKESYQFTNETSFSVSSGVDESELWYHEVCKLNSRSSTSVAPKQNVVPQILLDAYISMAENVSLEMKISCAYVFPAVLLTLGPGNWRLLKHAYSKLASDPERRLRLMIASSIHDIASILGPELATQDLIPIYNALINDMEDIRITALNHLSCFVKLLKPEGRYMFLPHLMEFMMTDYTLNWRFREQLSEQLIEMMDLFNPSDCWKYVSPVAFLLLMDRVSAVRLQALNLVTHLIRVVSADMTLLRGILADLAEQFAHSTQWARRQSFAFLCSSLMKTPVLPDDMFARDVLPHLLDLSWDGIPNVRIAVARTLSCDVATHPYFSNIFSPHYEVLATVLKRLCGDKDRDVRYFASLNVSALPSLTTREVDVRTLISENICSISSTKCSSA